MSESKRGIAPELLVSLVQNTAPFLESESGLQAEYIEKYLALKNATKLSHEEYFTLCLCAHYITVATFVPTDVDNQIRQKLWNQKLAPGCSERMAAIVLEAKNWNALAMTERYATSPASGESLSGHDGEWFSVAVGAYAAHRTKNPSLASEIFEAIYKELKREAAIFFDLKAAKEGIGLLKAATLIAHNLGDLDRVTDQWNLPADDALRVKFYKAGHGEKPEWNILFEAGNLNKEYMASENHRHYPLRAAKSLRISRKFLLPTGPFFDDWGATLVRSELLSSRELAEICEALVEGFFKLSSPKIPLHGYARALAGIISAYPGGEKKLSLELPAKVARQMKDAKLWILIQVSQKVFENEWNRKALEFLRSASPAP